MNKLAYTTLIAFISSILTLVGAYWLVPSHAQSDSQGRIISLEELAQHNHAASCWKVIDGRVYDITDYIDEHPTPESVLTDWCGMESTEAWYDKGNGRPHSPGALALLAQFDIGVLAGHETAGSTTTEVLTQVEDPKTAKAATANKVSELMGEQQEMTMTRTAQQGYRDGSYYAESEPDSRGWRGLVEISIVNSRITSVYYDEIQRDDEGNYKARKSDDMNYAERWRRVSQISQLSAFRGYENMLILTGTIDEVDALTGATSSFESFQRLVREALTEAR